MKKFDSTAFVPAVNPEAIQRDRPTRATVAASAAENALAGFGAACMIVAGWLALWSVLYQVGAVAPAWPNVAQMLIAAAIAGLATFGFLSWARHALDEFESSVRWLRMKHDLHRMAVDFAALQAEVKEERRLRAIAEAQAAIAESWKNGTRNLVQPDSPGDTRYDDARRLIVAQFNGSGWQRDKVVTTGSSWTQAQWKTAMGVLERCGIAVLTTNSGYQPWDKRATFNDAMAVWEKFRHDTVIVQAGRLGRVVGENGDTAHLVTTTNDDDWSRGVA